MFTVLELIEEQKKGFLDFSKIFRKPKLEITETDLGNGKNFYVCRAEVRKGKIPLREIEKVSPSGLFLLPPNISEAHQLQVFTPNRLPQIMLFNTAVDYIKEKALPPTKTQITIIDREGIYVDKFKEIIKLASHITVITSDDRYRNLSDELLSAFGLSLIIRKEFYDDKAENQFLFDYNAESIPLSYKGIAFSREKKHLMSGKTLTPGGFNLPEEYENLRNKNINKLHFASALYELCEVKELSALKFNELCS